MTRDSGGENRVTGETKKGEEGGNGQRWDERNNDRMERESEGQWIKRK